MPLHTTPYDWLVFTGLAITAIAFYLMFGRKRKSRAASSSRLDDRGEHTF